MVNVKWNDPETKPKVKVGTEEQYWIAVHSKYTGENHTLVAQYQNRPLPKDFDDNEDCDECDCLYSPDGEPIDSVRWVSCKSHVEFDDFYEAIGFDDNYTLLGWAEYEPPEFTGVSV